MDLEKFIEEAHAIAVDKGWWEEKRTISELMCLCLSEAGGELVEALRHGNPESEKIPGHSQMAEELADVAIRLGDWVEGVEAGRVTGTYSKNDPSYLFILILRLCSAIMRGDIEEAFNSLRTLAKHLQIDLEAALEAKMEYNRNRPHRHGGKAF